jgi:hypothetical protein
MEEELLKMLNDSVNNFNSSLSVIQSDILAEVELLIKDIKVSNGKIVQDITNLKKINKLKEVISKAVISPEYEQRVIDFGKAFSSVEEIQASYFSSLVTNYTAPKVLEEIKKIAIEDTVAGLTEAGLQANVSDKIADLLRLNIESGAKYTDMVKELKLFIEGDKETLGAMEKYAGQITTDAINQYSATYNMIVTDDLGMEWSTSVGALVEGSRDLCEKLVHKKYIHKSELPQIIKGKIDGVQIPISTKTGLPYGMIAGTNTNNFRVRRGGHRCNHLYLGVPDERVPESIRVKFDKQIKATA